MFFYQPMNDTTSIFEKQLEHLELEPYNVTQSNYTITLTELQRRGISFMIRREMRAQWGQYGGLICDCLGLGKTAMCLATITERLQWVKQTINENQKTLVVAPTNVMFEWEAQTKKHITPGTLRVVTYYGQNRSFPDPDTFDVLLTSYGVVQREYSDTMRIEDSGIVTHWTAPKTKNGDPQRSPFTFNYDRVLIDEAHNIRNRNTGRYRSIVALNGEARWAITGTMIYNKIDDLFAPLSFIGAQPYGTWQLFDAEIARKIYIQPQSTMSRIQRFLLPIELRRTKALLGLPPITDEHIYVDLVDEERLFYDSLLDYSRNTVQRLFRVHKWLRRTGWARAHTNLSLRARQCILASVLRLRQACVNPQMAINAFKRFKNLPIENGDQASILQEPRLLESATRRLTEIVNSRNANNDNDCGICYDSDADHALIPCGHTLCGTCASTIRAMNEANAQCPFCKGSIDDSVIIEHALQEHADSTTNNDDNDIQIEQEWPMSTKITYFINHLQGRLTEDNTCKFLVFSQWRVSLDNICRALEQNGIRYLRIDGTVTNLKTRFKYQDEFNNNPDIIVMVCSLNCSSEGINLQSANVAYILDPWWTDTREEQAGNRAHRLGQHRAVTIYHIIARNTIEERVLRIQQQKRDLRDATNGALSSMSWDNEVRHLLDL